MTCGISYQDPEGRAVLARVLDQGQAPPFDPRSAVDRFATVLRDYRITRVVGDAYAGQTFAQDFLRHGIIYEVAGLTGFECQKRQAAIAELERLLPSPEQTLRLVTEVVVLVLEAVVTIDREALVRRVRESGELEQLRTRFERLRAMANTHETELKDWTERAGRQLRVPWVTFPWPPVSVWTALLDAPAQGPELLRHDQRGAPTA
jgi:hypothetical protein